MVKLLCNVVTQADGRPMAKFEVRSNMAYVSQMQFDPLWVQQAQPRIVFESKFWEKAAHDSKMTTYLQQGVKDT